MSQFEMDLEWPQNLVNEPQYRYVLNYVRIYITGSAHFDHNMVESTRQLEYLKMSVKRKNEIKSESLKVHFQVGNKMNYYLCAQEQQRVENNTFYQQTYYHRITLYYLEMPLHIYENSKECNTIAEIAQRYLIESNYELTTLVIENGLPPQQILQINQNRDDSKWEKVPVVPAKEGHIFL